MELGVLPSIILVLVLVILLTLWAVSLQLLKQQGRILLRLDNLENEFVGGALSALGRVHRQSSDFGVGAPIAPFSLNDLDGNVLGPSDFLGKRILLIYWNPGCGYCARIAEDLSRLQPSLNKSGVQMLFVCHGGAKANRGLAVSRGLNCPFLLINDDADVPKAFARMGTPAACLLDEEGKVARPLAVGSDQVAALVREAAGRPDTARVSGDGPLVHSRIERNGLKPGTPAPEFCLPDLYGRQVSLRDYLGLKVLLVFGDPHCEPCDQLAPHLARLHRENGAGGFEVLMVSRGELEENRLKAQKNNLQFPIVLQRKWEISREYGIFFTPVAFVIGTDGRIVANAAKGVDQVMTLALAHSGA